MTLKAIEFIRRFLLHVLPAGFVRIRHYGFLANRVCREKLELCRDLLAAVDADPSRPGRSPGRKRPSKDGPRPTPAPPAGGPDGHRRDLAGGPGPPERRGGAGADARTGGHSIRPEPSARGEYDRMNRRRRDRPSGG